MSMLKQDKKSRVRCQSDNRCSGYHEPGSAWHLGSSSTHADVAGTWCLSCRQRHLKILYVCHILNLHKQQH